MPENASGSSRPSGSPSGDDWAAEVTDRVEKLVESVRAKTSDRLVGFARLLVFGLLAAFMGVTALVLLVIAAVRVLDVVIPRGVWLPDLILGAIFVAVGAFLWSKRTAPSRP